MLKHGKNLWKNFVSTLMFGVLVPFYQRTAKVDLIKACPSLLVLTVLKAQLLTLH